MSHSHLSHNKTASIRDASTAATAPRRQVKALLIGNNYIGSSCELHGCVNDQMNMYNWLMRIQPDAEVRFLSDAPSAAIPIYAVSTRDNMIAGMKWLVEGATADSRLFMAYSGHGSYQINQSCTGDKNDPTRDDMICPIDFEQSGGILDDELRAILVDPLPAGARLSVVLDCCFSGTCLDLRFNYEDASIYVGHAVGDGSAVSAAAHKGARKRGFLFNHNHSQPTAPEGAEYDPALWHRRIIYEFTDKAAPSAADVIMISGCSDLQTSADAFEDGKPAGALTYAFLRFADDQSPHARADPAQRTVGNLLQDLCGWMATANFKQRPQISFGKHTDIDLIWHWF
jgi:hypothetical protein